ncbi:hypothetical protein GOBAR_AA07698 [Gossypium barbadense]|uniref:Uncharacterized protein n=1 Tax=Gossypium barbadense TaxID=3634 RepID=A0A2P5YBJ4_GOSBA|nr:hypothetical protein GOBAR_AA07698 [Gossypium barbadense]
MRHGRVLNSPKTHGRGIVGEPNLNRKIQKRRANLQSSVRLSCLQFRNRNYTRNIIIRGLSLFLGISIPQFFNQYWNPSHHGLAHTDVA